jgi:hypothetical protein
LRIAYLVDVHGRFEAVPRALSEIGEVDLVIIGGAAGAAPRGLGRRARGSSGPQPRLTEPFPSPPEPFGRSAVRVATTRDSGPARLPAA